MLFLKIISVIFFILIPIFSAILVKLTGLRKRGIKFTDLAFPMYVFSLYVVSDKLFYHSLLPVIVFILSALSLSIAYALFYKTQDFQFRRYFKIFWRASFLITSSLYLVLVIYTLFFR